MWERYTLRNINQKGKTRKEKATKQNKKNLWKSMKLSKKNAYGGNVCLEKEKLSKKMKEIKKMIFKNRGRKKGCK